ncbi:alpha beta-hydrolase [Lecanosticta acicola]|uniref:Alpha beta-hydrolase n=1 Tax=Lecanosticta acicola TaxID=111012 RepID=A0AAI8Z500_9PEZI|nr:alpha beta-hydrolase [Lecanosticta acicola]
MATQIILFAVGVGLATAQFPPTPEGVRTIKSKFHPGVEVSYKEPGLCETTPGVKSYAGYVHLPVDALNETHEHNEYPINLFYWFFESRKDPTNAPLAIWLNGGPGGSSLLGALSENGPCFVNNDSQTTVINPWSWNNEANLLYIDQPNQVGYSYDVLTNVTVNFAPHDEQEGGIQPADFSNGVPAQNNTFFVGTMSSQNRSQTANSTQHAAVAMWHFAQTWFTAWTDHVEEFPNYKPHDERISLFTESYGGHYGPGFMDYFVRQNDRITDGTLPKAHYLHLGTLGIINGCIDAPDMMESEIEFAYNNTYGLEAITKEEYESSMHEFHRPGGVLEAIHACREMARKTDPHDHGEKNATNTFCKRVEERAANISEGVYVREARGARFDITHEPTDPFPGPYMFGWLNQPEVQKAFGVPVNHSWHSHAIANVLGHGVNVHLFHGDRDFACNWIGGERYSLNIPWPHQKDFQEAGYTPLVLSSPYTQSGGLTRQYGNLSFTRVYQAGHMVPSYQPEAAYRIFMRALTGKDIATGEIDLNHHSAMNKKQYSTTGPSDTWWMKNDVLPQPPHTCYVLDMGSRCSKDEINSIVNGTAVIKDWILVGTRGTAETETSFDGAKHGGQTFLLGDW